MNRGTVVVMAKVPQAGRVKTRAGRDIGMVRAAWWMRHQLGALIWRLNDPHWRLVVALSPDNKSLTLGKMPDLVTIPQGHGDLGQRMRRGLEAVASGPVMLIGADCPAVDRHHVRRAFRALGNADFVFGPAEDGGFWLVGAARRRALPPRLFMGARWSTRHALADTLATLNGQRHALTDRLADADTAADLLQTPPARRVRSWS